MRCRLLAHLRPLARCANVVGYLRYCGRAGRTGAAAVFDPGCVKTRTTKTQSGHRTDGIRGTKFKEYWYGLPNYSGFIPANLTTLPHFSISAAMSLPKSVGDPGSTVVPRSASLAFILASARAALISLFSLPMIAEAVFLGAPRPNAALAS